MVYLELCMFHDIDIDTEPILSTTFDPSNIKKNIFHQTKYDIKYCDHFDEKQCEHFLEIISSLEKSNYPFNSYESIHIFNSSIENTNHYVQIRNILFDKKKVENVDNDNESNENKIIDDNKLENKLYINYRPGLFKKQNLFNKIIFNSFNKMNFNSLFSSDTKSKPKSKWLSSVLNGATFFNCFIYIAMYWFNKNPNINESLIQHPFENSFGIIVDSVIYGSLATWISNLGPNYTGRIIVNGILFWININLFAKIRSGNSF